MLNANSSNKHYQQRKDFSNTDNADSLPSFKRDFDSYTIELCNSAGNQLSSFCCYPGFQNQNGGKGSSFYCSTIYSKAGAVNGCIYGLGNLHAECLLSVFICLLLSLSFNLHLFTNQICACDSSLAWITSRVITAK